MIREKERGEWGVEKNGAGKWKEREKWGGGEKKKVRRK
jgi:hypothetical protein